MPHRNTHRFYRVSERVDCEAVSEWSQARVARRRGSTHHKQRHHGVGQRHRTIITDIVAGKAEIRDGVVGLMIS